MGGQPTGNADIEALETVEQAAEVAAEVAAEALADAPPEAQVPAPAADPAPPSAQPVSLMDSMPREAEARGISLEQLQQEYRDFLGIKAGKPYDPRDLDGNPILFFRCTKTYYGPIRQPDGGRVVDYRQHPNSPITELGRVWVKGRIYPFRTSLQLEKTYELLWVRDEHDQIVYMDNPKAKGDPRADQIPKPLMELDTATGTRRQKRVPVEKNGGIANFKVEDLSENEIYRFLHGEGLQKTGIENPVNGARNHPANFVRRGAQAPEGRRLSPEQKSQMLTRERELVA